MKEGIGISEPIKRLDRREDRWAPRYLAMAQPLAKYGEFGPSLIAKISDFGASFMSLDQVEEPVTPVALRAPELVLGLAFDQSIDIWSFGYLPSELVTGTMVFEVDSCGEKTPENDAQTNGVHIMEFTDRLGAPLEYLLQKWPRRERYYGKDGTQTRWSVEPGEDLAEKHPVCLLEDFILKERFPDIS